MRPSLPPGDDEARHRLTSVCQTMDVAGVNGRRDGTTARDIPGGQHHPTRTDMDSCVDATTIPGGCARRYLLTRTPSHGGWARRQQWRPTPSHADGYGLMS